MPKKLTLGNFIPLPLDSLLLRGVSARPFFCLRARCRKHERRHVRPRDGLKAGLGLTPCSNRLSNGRAMGNFRPFLVVSFMQIRLCTSARQYICQCIEKGRKIIILTHILSFWVPFLWTKGYAIDRFISYSRLLCLLQRNPLVLATNRTPMTSDVVHKTLCLYY